MSESDNISIGQIAAFLSCLALGFNLVNVINEKANKELHWSLGISLGILIYYAIIGIIYLLVENEYKHKGRKKSPIRTLNNRNKGFLIIFAILTVILVLLVFNKLEFVRP